MIKKRGWVGGWLTYQSPVPYVGEGWVVEEEVVDGVLGFGEERGEEEVAHCSEVGAVGGWVGGWVSYSLSLWVIGR